MGAEEEAKKNRIMAAFAASDTSHNGTLDFKEFKALLRQGGEMPELQLRSLFEACDTDRSGSIDFQEFVAFVFSPPKVEDARAPEECWKTYCKYLGRDSKQLTSSEFSKMCSDCAMF